MSLNGILWNTYSSLREVAPLSIFPNNAAESFSPSVVPFQTFPLSNTFSRFSLNWTKHVKNISKKYRLKLFIKEMKENQFWFFSFDPKMFSFDPGQVLELMPGICGWSLDFRMWGGAAWNNLCGSEENKKGWETDYCQCAVADWSWGQNQHNHRFGSWIEMHYWSVRLMKTFPKQVVSIWQSVDLWICFNRRGRRFILKLALTSTRCSGRESAIGLNR